ncbi:Rieske (2Fe-2S) protein [Bradyrhizobium sp. 41S5]|uniref:Rieske (2Fe-2S) protein n=1 Tax=Bradyrhizobium sp. 41S5 TaxID=1404443 RepID=UPI00156A7AAE|nr:Rieske (2Fe-2S) protein [Bradyrhizobium sp. 41S5]UFX44134.1 Rieske (2Fe-2S) protein [Bradyrhizobium sp. 41S5]
MVKERVGLVKDIPPGKNKVVTVRGREIVVFNVHGDFFAFLNRCPHEGAKLCHGVVVGLPESDAPGSYQLVRKGEILRCPWHGWEFDLRTGKSKCAPQQLFTKRYQVTIETASDNKDELLTAETFPVSVEDAVIFVEV